MRLREEKGFSWSQCLAFDLACLEFVERYEREEEATREVPMTAADKKRRQTKLVPKHTPDALLAMLGIDVAGVRGESDPDEAMVDALARDILTGRADWLGA